MPAMSTAALARLDVRGGSFVPMLALSRWARACLSVNRGDDGNAFGDWDTNPRWGGMALHILSDLSQATAAGVTDGTSGDTRDLRAKIAAKRRCCARKIGHVASQQTAPLVRLDMKLKDKVVECTLDFPGCATQLLARLIWCVYCPPVLAQRQGRPPAVSPL